MANRTIQQKILKMKRRGRFARFSGATSKFATKLDYHQRLDGEGRTIEYLVGEVSLGNQTISTGRGPDKERMQTYYNRITPESKQEILPEDLGIKDPRYLQVWKEYPPQNRMNIATTAYGRLDLFTTATGCFFVDIDFKRKTIKRSRDYPSVTIAKERLALKRILWEVETSL